MVKVQSPRVWEVDITPDISLFKKVGSQPYRIPDAVAELVDNEIDAGVPEEKLIVRVTLRMGKSPTVIVEGNGSGMTPETAAMALRMAYSQKSPGQIGEFGLGMKAACSNLGRSFELTTCTAESERATRVVYDEDEFLRGKEWKIRLEEVEKPFEHGTRITITDLKVNVYAGLKDTMLNAFGRIFRHFLIDGEVEIIVNDEPVVPEEPELLEQCTTEFSFEVQGHQIRGWSGLMRRSSQTGGYGFELIRHKRAMRRHEKIGFKPHPRLAWITGEIHLDTFPVTNNKMDFVRDTPLWREFETTIGKLTTEIRSMSAALASKKRVDQHVEAQAEDARDEVQRAINSNAFQQTLSRRALDAMLTEQEQGGDGENASVDVEQRQRRNGHELDQTEAGDGTTPPRTPRITHERVRRVKTILAQLAIEHNFVSLGEDSPYKIWDLAAINPVRKLAVATNLDHPMYAEAAEDLVLWVKHNMVEAAAEYLCAESGIREMLLLKSDILKHIGRIKLEEITEAPALN